MNNLNPLSPSKRAINSISPVSSPKKQRIVLEAAIQAIASAEKPKNLKTKATIELLKGRLNQQKPALQEFIQKRDLEGLRQAFDHRIYHAGNEKGKNELIQAIKALSPFQNEENQESIDQLGFALAELMVQIEDPEFLAEMEFQEFFSDCLLIDQNTVPLLVLLNGTLSFICEYSLNALRNFRSPIHQYTVMHYAAAQGDEEIILWLKKQGFDILEQSRDGHTPMDFLLRAIAKKRDTPTDVTCLFESLFCNERFPSLTDRLVAAMCLLGNCVSCGAWQIAVLVKKKMVPWAEKWDQLAQDAAGHLAQLPPSLGKMALQGSMEALSMRDVKERTLLHWAIALENRPLIEKLMDTELFGQVDWFLRSPLHLAAVIPGIDPSILRLFVEKAPKMALQGDTLGHAPLHLALNSCLYENFAALYVPGMEKPLLLPEDIWYAATNQVDQFRDSLIHDGPVRKDVIHCAVALGHRAIVAECLKHDLSWHVPNRQGLTPLALAVQKNDAAMIETLFRDIERIAPPLDRKTILELIRLALKHPNDIDLFFVEFPPDALFSEVLEGYTPHFITECYGGPALARKLKESNARLGFA